MTAILEAPKPTTDPAVNVEYLATLLLGDWPDVRLRARQLATDPDLIKVEGLSCADHRAAVLEKLKKLAASGMVKIGFPAHCGGNATPGPSIVAFEELIAADPSAAIKSGVQWGLFSSAILHLGTADHHERLLPSAVSLATPGIFAMTETGHGSDVAGLATTATYDPETEEFVIHTPFKGAWKDYLGNAALHGQAAVVFARLITQGVDHGVHAFYVPVRNPETGEFLPGVGGDDDGLKGGLNGIDNGRLWFDHVRIPRRDLLSRYGDVAADGTYSSPIASPGRRFFTMISTLVQGRVSLTGSANIGSKLGLITAITYGNERRQFDGAKATEEVVLLDYLEHQRRLLIPLSTAYAIDFAQRRLLRLYDHVFSDPEPSDELREQLETMAAALKSLSTWNVLDTLQVCREACGGAGFLTENRITSLRQDLDIFVTFEGDNTVLLQLVAKRLLAAYSRELGNIDAGGVARYVADRAADVALHRVPLKRIVQSAADAGSARRSAGQLRETEVQRELIQGRAEAMVTELGSALRPATKAPRDVAADLFNEHQHELIETARAHGELLLWEAFTDALESVEDEGTRRILTRVRDLFALSIIAKHLDWYLMNGRISAHRARTVGTYIDRLCGKLRPHAADLVAAWGYGPESVRAAIATGAEGERQREAMDYYRAQRASANAPVPEPKPAKKR